MIVFYTNIVFGDNPTVQVFARTNCYSNSTNPLVSRLIMIVGAKIRYAT